MMTTLKSRNKDKIAVVIPCYRVTEQVLGVIEKIGPEVDVIYCIDDNCPDGSGDLIRKKSLDNRVRVVRHNTNLGVGGATLTGYRHAVDDGAEVIVKIDGDGQMDPKLLGHFVAPILNGNADYVKGNRFYNLGDPKGMPFARLFGNACLSFMTKFSSGYWYIFDPTNGYTAVHGAVARRILDCPVSKGYFFESDILFHLNLMRAVVVDVSMQANYGDEDSNLRVRRILLPFMIGHVKNTFRRTLLQYFLRDFSLASIELLVGALAVLFGLIFGAVEWIRSVETQEVASAGTVMTAALPIIIGIQFLFNAINYDMRNVPSVPIHPYLRLPDSPKHRSGEC